MWSHVSNISPPAWSGDYRIDDNFLMSTPYPTILASVIYVVFVTKIGPKMMENRSAYELRVPMIIYNFTVMLINLKIFVDGGRYGWLSHYSWRCAEYDMTDSIVNRGIANAGWLFFISKLIEFSDTLFFVARKKQKQITLLHVVHHSLLPISCWFTVKYAPVGHATFLGFTNSFVHVLMYGYYAAAAVGPSMSPYLWWKKYLTTIQMVQFVVMFLHSIQVFFADSCSFPRWSVWFNIGHAVLFMALFADFYRTTYSNAKSSKLKVMDHTDRKYVVKDRSSLNFVDNESTPISSKLPLRFRGWIYFANC